MTSKDSAIKENALSFCYDLYLDYFNNFLTLQKFAEYYSLDYEVATKVIELGRAISETKGNLDK